MKIALLSNINLNPIICRISKSIDIYGVEGYGNELGCLLNPDASLYQEKPDIIFLIEDTMELIGHHLDKDEAAAAINCWFDTFESALQKEILYFVSDPYLYGIELEIVRNLRCREQIEALWQNRLDICRKRHPNVYIFPYRSLVEVLGERQAFSKKMWYMGKIPYSLEMQRLLAGTILRQTNLAVRISKKVIILDLDNTLWGGLAGEADKTPITLSDDGLGLAYKNLQRVLLLMKKQGVILCIASKNNKTDALDIIEKHPHMILRSSDFAIMKINWRAKHENITEIAEELNLGLDSMVFFDDNPAEGQLVKEMLPDVTVPDFPENPEQLAEVMANIYQEYFDKLYVTEEDLLKTTQYQARQKRSELQLSAASFEEYLKNLQIKLTRVDAKQHVDRLVQLINKTNQFNLTTVRLSRGDIEKILADDTKEVFLYQAADRFGDNGIISAAIVAYGEQPEILEFVMSCRVMGEQIEQAIVEQMEQAAKSRGYTHMRGKYVPTGKNRPVCGLFPALGYSRVDSDQNGAVFYEISLEKTPKRCYQIERGE